MKENRMSEKENLRKLLYGEGAHTNALHALEALNDEQIGSRPAKAPHSIYQILWHMIYWQEYELANIAGKPPSYPTHAIESWPPETAPRNLSEWNETIQKFAAGLKRYEALLDDPAADWERVVNAKKNETVRDVVWMIVAHNSHHLGQIIMLRQQLGAWPPPKGSDTW
jgi:uncharacterized damage-inducible protein DinB